MQALLLWNDPQYVEAARALAQRVLAGGCETDEQRAALLFQLATGRTPNVAEVQDLTQACAEELAHYSTNEDAARDLLKVGSIPAPADLNASQLAAWTITANLVLNLDEVIMKN